MQREIVEIYKTALKKDWSFREYVSFWARFENVDYKTLSSNPINDVLWPEMLGAYYIKDYIR